MAQSPSSNDPYAGIGAPDPYASIGGGADPYASVGKSPYAEVIEQAQSPNPVDVAIAANAGGSLGPDSSQYHPSTLGKAALRIGVPLTVGVASGGLGLIPAMALSGATGVLTEAGAEGLEVAGRERDSLSVSQIAASGLLNSFPGIPLTKIASPFIRGGIRVAEGAALGGAYPLVEAGLRGKLANPEDVGHGALFGAGIGLLPGALELSHGRTFGGAQTDLIPSELGVVGDAMRAPLAVPDQGLPPPTMTAPAELAAVNKVREEFAATQAAAIEKAKQQTSDAAQAASAAKAKALGERMMGVESPEGKLAILDQELALQKDTLTDAERRAGLDMKLALKQQIDQQNALEKAARDQQAGQKAQQQALADVQEAQQLAAPEAPQVPKSTQIIDEVNAPQSLANAAAIGAKQAEGNLNQLQSQVNQMAVAPAGPSLSEPTAPAASLAEPVNIGPRDASVSDGSGVPTAKEEVMLAKQKEMIDEHLATQKKIKDVSLPDGTLLTNAIRSDNIIMLSFDITGNVPKRSELKKIINNLGYDAEVVDFQPNIFSTANGEVKFRIDVFSRKDGSMAKSAEEMYNKVFGTNERISVPTATQRAVPMEERVAGTVRAYRRRETGEAPGPSEPTPSTQELRLNNADLELPPLSQMTRAEKRTELDAAGITTYNGKPIDEANPAEVSNAVGKLRRGQLERGAVNPKLLTSLASTGAGAAYGATQGNSAEERARNAILYGSIGLGGGLLAGSLINKAVSRPIRQYQAQPLKDVAQMLTPIEEKSSLFEKLADAYGNFRYRFNTRFAPIGDAQRALYKETGKTFTPSRYYDLERGFERLAGAPVQAEGEVELLQNIIDKLPKQDVPHLDTYLTLARIEDRLVKTAEENTHLQDAVGRAQAEVDAAVTANAASPSVRNAGAVVARRAELNAATKRLSEDFDRKRVGDWSISKARQGLADLQSEIGPEAFNRLQSAGSEYQNVMQRALQIQVDSGRMSQDLMDRVLATNDFYAPFKVLKYFEEGAPFVKGGGTMSIPSSEQLVKRITGIDDADVRIGGPTNVAAEQVYKGYILAQKNRKLRELATLSRIDPNGDYVKPLNAEMEPRKGYEAVSYFVNGEPKRLEVSRPIAKALTGIDATDTDIIMRVLGKTAGAFKLGATGLNIPFNIANAGIFDPMRLATISRYGFRGPQDFLYTMYEWPKALFSSARGNLFNSPDALYEQWIKSGAAGSTLARQLTPEAFSARLPKDMKTGEIIADTNGWLGAPIKVAGLISNTLEETTKLLGLERATRIERLDKLTPQQREQKWDEIVTELRNYAGSPDFSRAGVSMKPLNILFPFLNARWQGALADTARLNPFRQGNAADAGAAWARLTSLVGIPAASLAYYNLSTPENERDYLQIPKTERERYFHIPVNVGEDGKPTILGTGKGYYFNNKDGVQIRAYYRIPKREFPGLAANTIEDFMEYAKGTHPETFSQLASNFGENTAATISPLNIEGDTLGDRALSAASGVNPLLRLPVEVGLNRNLFTRQPIVPQGREKASPELQFGANTPQAYKDAAAALPATAPDFLRSPAKLQHVTEGFTGGFARQFAAPKLSPGNPAGESSPLLGRFYRSERVESEDLLRGANEAERGRADQRIKAEEISSKLTEIINSKGTPEEKQKALSDAADLGLLTPDVQTYLKEDLMDSQRGLTYEDRVVKRSYSVAGGFRAKYFADKLKGMTPGQRQEYLQDQFAKGLLTRDVQGQLAQLLQQP